MRRAFETYELGMHREIVDPKALGDPWVDHTNMVEVTSI